MTLAGVYKATEIYMLQDSSEDNTNTWAFLDRRIDDLQTAGKAARNVRSIEKYFLDISKGYKQNMLFQIKQCSFLLLFVLALNAMKCVNPCTTAPTASLCPVKLGQPRHSAAGN